MRTIRFRAEHGLATFLVILGMQGFSPPTPAASEPGRPRIGLVLAGGGAKGGAHVGVARKQLRGYTVDALVRALGREDRRAQKLVRIAVVESATRIGVGAEQLGGDPACALPACGLRFPSHGSGTLA